MTIWGTKHKTYMKCVVSLLLAICLALSPLCLAVTYAEDDTIPTPSDTVAVEPTPTVTQDTETPPTDSETIAHDQSDVPLGADVTNTETSIETDSSSIAESGDNVITDPTPTVQPSIDPETHAASGSAEERVSTGSAILASPDEVHNAPSPTASNGGSADRPSEERSAHEPQTVVTGNATSIAIIDQSVNTTEINATTVRQTINIFVPNTDDIDIKMAVLKATAETLSGPHAGDDAVNVGVTVSNQMVYLENSIVSRAITGQNMSEGNDSSVQTGDATSVVSLINSVNTTIINSVIHFYTINIFSVETGNILLPELLSTESDCCQGTIETVNGKTNVLTNVTSSADSGHNTISGTGTITSGDATSMVNVSTIADMTFINTAMYQLYINVFGIWDGQFRGWDTLTASAGGASISLLGYAEHSGTQTPDCCSDTISIENDDVTVRTTVSSEATSGGNLATGKNSAITTGNSFSAVHILNLINTSFINSSGMFAVINIFGRLTGDIGGASTFQDDNTSPTPEPERHEAATVSQGNPVEKPREEGGKLSVTNNNNVGSFVYPGDTVTFFVKVKNIGTGMVYDAGIDLFLINEYGEQVGGRHYSLGHIALNSGSKLTTGFVLSPQTPPGTYTARAVASGSVGPDNRTISSVADSSFVVFGSEYVTNNPDSTPFTTGHSPEVKGVSYTKSQSGNILKALLVLLLLIPLFLGMKISEIRGKLRFIFTNNQDVLAKLRTLQLLVL